MSRETSSPKLNQNITPADPARNRSEKISQTQPAPSRSERRIQDYHTQEWSSGTRGGGSIPADFGWPTNPKQYQEEYGSSTIDEERDLEKERTSKR